MFDYFERKGDNNQLSDKLLSLNLLVFLLLFGGERISIIYWFTINRVTITDTGATCFPAHVFKHSKPGRKKIPLSNLFQYFKTLS